MPIITYSNKSYIYENSSVADINKVRDVDMNEIKDVINNTLIATLGLTTQTWSSGTTYSEGDIVVYNNLLYQNITGSSTTTNPASDTTNWEQTTILVND